MPRARCLPFPLRCLPRTRGGLQCAIAFFFLSTRFATSLTFVFRSFSSASRIKREFSGLSADVDPLSSSTSSPCSSTRAPSALERKISLRRRGFRLYDSKGTSPRTTRPLPSSRRRRRSAPHQHGCRKSENPRFVFFLFPHSKRIAAAFSLPRARCLPSSLCCLPRIRGHASSPLLFFFLSTRFATSLTFVFRSFSSAFRITREFSGPSSAFPQTSTHSPATSSPCSSTRAPSALERKISLRRRGDSGSGSQASTLRQQGNFAEERAAVALVAAKKQEALRLRQGRRQT